MESSDHRADRRGGREAERFAGGPRPLGAIVPRVTRPAFRRYSPAAVQIMADWPEVVGPGLAALAVPRRLAQGTLTLACAGPVALELSHLAPQLIARINAHCGRVAVRRLRFVQAPAAAAGAGHAARRGGGTPAAAARLPSGVSEALGRVGAPDLRAALEKLARGVYRSSQAQGADPRRIPPPPKEMP
jgi:hypothetical protein